MTGTTNGLVAQLKRMIVRDHGIDNCNIDPVWCFAHRLNLVICDFQHVPFIKSVFRFCDWFTTKRKAVVYKKWLKQSGQKESFGKIPKPSETRWSFYDDVLGVLLDQIEQVDKFLCDDKDFREMKISLWPYEIITSDIPRKFFEDKFVIAHFRFARFVLDRVCLTNTKLQERYLLLPHAWVMINKLKQDFIGSLEEIRSHTFSSFDYLTDLTEGQLLSFQTILNAFLLKMDVRFPCPSFSMDTRKTKHYIDQTLWRIDPTFTREVQKKCPLFELVGLFLFPNDLIRKREINPIFLSGKYPEIPSLACEIVEKENEIISAKNTSQNGQVAFETKHVITIIDVFVIIQREKYPLLWKTTLKTLSLLPTSVECEQSFSGLKHKMHQNMAKETAFNLFLSSRRKTEYCVFAEDSS